MAAPKPWSFSALDTFKTCQRQYHAKYVAKTVKEPDSGEMLWGKKVHTAFENRQAVSTPLPHDLLQHEAFMEKLEDKPGVTFTEQKFGLNLKAQPCAFFDRDIWCRGVKDYEKIHESTAVSIDYKTGKPHQKFEQLALAAIHTFKLYPDVELVNAQFYWTQPGLVTKKVWSRDDMPMLWSIFTPDLKQYREAFEHDIWQPRQSGLCNGWCPVRDCEFWRPKRERTER